MIDQLAFNGVYEDVMPLPDELVPNLGVEFPRLMYGMYGCMH